LPKIKETVRQILIHTVRKLLGITLLASALLMPMANNFSAARVEASEQIGQVALM
jgi:hypothetical protein